MAPPKKPIAPPAPAPTADQIARAEMEALIAAENFSERGLDAQNRRQEMFSKIIITLLIKLINKIK
jgi:hypothetical protein